ncbi:MAG TPA: DUF502 domain-containing protein [bacterium]|nr:DUF502 domain-containing protein [bacterium]
MRSRLRTYFITGLIVFLPVAITISVLAWLFRVMDSLLGWLLPPLLGRDVPGLGLAASLVVIFLLGVLGTNVLGKRLVAFFERLLLRIPLARSIYSATKSVSAVIFQQRRGAFQRPVLVEWPRAGLWTIAFVTGETPEGLPGISRRLLNVFVVTTPNPTTGFLMFVPEAETCALPMSVEDALKIVMSGGIVSPTMAAAPRSVPAAPAEEAR